MKPIEKYGYNAVGKGWLPILEELDSIFNYFLEMAKRTTPNAKIEISQIKEKFGTLRVYVETFELSKSWHDEIQGAISMAELMSGRLCEHCGSTEEVETRGNKSEKFSWVRTLCGTCHAYRDEAAKRGDGPWPDPIPATELNAEVK